ncbi:uncharacterized protein LOC105833722 isoform X2 [Monomorium pharaonis]|uniref:uncharacterized protein LOC105833722 isoform X2 n=1 Tax=Monomorium pharaonis TaxID=307658 RepID=UPI00063FA395|nr:uncharacterized protein LOC105833722 isoform X2 [Monomorium pharaonis]
MWCFKGREGFCVYILPDQKKSFGKSQSDIKLEGDATISRLHAVVSVEPTGESEMQYKCVITDISKYGTFIIRDKEKIKLSANNKFILRAGDTVQFGLKESTFVVLCHVFIIASSSLNEDDTKKLKNIVYHLKAKLSETWENFCTHLTVAKSTLFTTKLACALASAKPIVTNVYWEAVNVAIAECKELPEIENFLPKVKEEWLNVCSRLFLPNEKRKMLFKGLSFVHFCTKQYFAYAPLITAAGGKSCVYPTKRPLTPQNLTAKNAIVIQHPTNDSLQFTPAIAVDYPIIYHKLQAVKRRIISDTEIPLAILHCTTEMYCNPKYDFATFFKSETPIFLPSDITIENTQDIVNTDTRQIKRKIIPETYETQYNENITKKVCLLDEKKKEYTFNLNKGDITDTMTQSSDDRKIRNKIISETCDSQTSKISKNSCLFHENERKYMPDTSESDITMKNVQNSDNRETKHKMIDHKSYNSQNNKNISEKTHFVNESEQRYVFDRNNISARRKNIMEDIYFSNESESKNIPSKSNVANDILSSNINKFQIIPDSCEKNSSNIFSSKSNNKRIQFFDTCKFKKLIVNDATEKERQNVKLQNKDIFQESNVTFARSNKKKYMLEENKCGFQQQENIIINDENNTIFEQFLNREKNSIVEKDHLTNSNNKFTTAWKSSKNTEALQIVSTKEINDYEICIKEEEKNLFGKGYHRVELQNSLRKQKLSSVYNSAKNQEDRRAKKDKIQTKDNKKEEPRKTGDNWRERCTYQEFTDEILRKDIPSGKKFIKMSVIKPEKVLTADDFVL